jgi:hypothetical protein
MGRQGFGDRNVLLDVPHHERYPEHPRCTRWAVRQCFPHAGHGSNRE